MSLLFFALLVAAPATAAAPSPTGVVEALYKEVIQRHPLGLWVGEDKAAIWPLLSTRLTRVLNDLEACETDYYEGNRKIFTPEEADQLKPTIGWLEYGLFSGGDEQAMPAEIEITKVVQGGGAFQVHVLFTYRDTFETYGRPPDDRNTFHWRGIVSVVHEAGRYAVDDFRLMDSDSGKLLPGLPRFFHGCKGRHWAGRQRY
jgi:hypothetical protein